MTDRPWGALPAIDPDPNARMCGVVNGRIICCRSEGHEGQHATPFPSKLRHGPVWAYWMCGGPFGSCHAGDPATHLYCGLEKGHDGPHLSPSNQRPGATLAEWSTVPSPPETPAPDDLAATLGGLRTELERRGEIPAASPASAPSRGSGVCWDCQVGGPAAGPCSKCAPAPSPSEKP